MRTARDRIATALDFLKSPIGALLLALLGLILAIYTGWFNDKKTELSVVVEASSTVISQSASLPGLEIRLDGQAIDQSKTPMQELLVGIWNSGDTTIRQVDFDPSAPVGFRVEGGRVVHVALEKASNSCLKGTVKPARGDDNAVTLNSAIFEPRDSVTVKVLILQGAGSRVSISPLGKIAGTPEVVERIVVWHPAGYPQGARTKGEVQSQKYFAAFVMAFAALNLVIAIGVRLFRRRRDTRDTDDRAPPPSDG